VFCGNSCDYCGGLDSRFEGSSPLCSGNRATLWETQGLPLEPFFVPECEDAGTDLPRYCCMADFEPVCP
jgi:hypothetical protein